MYTRYLTHIPHQYRRARLVAQAVLNRAVSGFWTTILFGLNSGQILSRAVAQPRKHKRDVESL